MATIQNSPTISNLPDKESKASNKNSGKRTDIYCHDIGDESINSNSNLGSGKEKNKNNKAKTKLNEKLTPKVRKMSANSFELFMIICCLRTSSFLKPIFLADSIDILK